MHKALAACLQAMPMQNVDEFTEVGPCACALAPPPPEKGTELMVEMRAPGDVKSALRGTRPLHWCIMRRGQRSVDAMAPRVTRRFASVAHASS